MTMAYIGREPECGCVTTATVDNGEHPADVARDVAQWLRWGMSIERIAIEKARVLLHSCGHWRIDSRGKRKRVEVPA